MPAGHRRDRDDLFARRRIAEQTAGIHGSAYILRSEDRGSHVTATGSGITAVQSPECEQAGRGKSRDAKGSTKETNPKTHSGLRRARQQDCKNDNGNSNSGPRHGSLAPALPSKPHRVTEMTQ
jgi:hypothetical protein